ncbi:hypothetical protein H0N99_00300 [Candidatus Micrarchaeota archaeon]|nr:hypothetical protein [Candidatus Micrarchaeota archaeon]
MVHALAIQTAVQGLNVARGDASHHAKHQAPAPTPPVAVVIPVVQIISVKLNRNVYLRAEAVI